MSETLIPMFVDVTGEAIREAEEARQRCLRIPEKARRNKKDKDEAWWTESLVVAGAEASQTENKHGDMVTVMQIKFEVANDGSPENFNAQTGEGKSFMDFWRINPKAVAAGDRDDGQYKMSSRSNALLVALMTAAGIVPDLPAGPSGLPGYSAAAIGRCFAPNNPSPLLNTRLKAEVHQSKDDSGRPRDEINLIFPPQSGVGGVTTNAPAIDLT